MQIAILFACCSLLLVRQFLTPAADFRKVVSNNSRLVIAAYSIPFERGLVEKVQGRVLRTI